MSSTATLLRARASLTTSRGKTDVCVTVPRKSSTPSITWDNNWVENQVRHSGRGSICLAVDASSGIAGSSTCSGGELGDAAVQAVKLSVGSSQRTRGYVSVCSSFSRCASPRPSMQAGTPEKAMREAVAQFCQEEFANRRYVAAFHDDTDHTHVHVCVSPRDIDRADEPRLSPRKADLFRWRLGFADKLRENEIDAAASERRHRFNYRKPEHPVVRQIRPTTRSHKPQHPAEERILASKAKTLATWNEVAQNLGAAGAQNWPKTWRS